MDTRDDTARRRAPEGLEYVEMDTAELAVVLREGGVIYVEPTHDLHYQVSLEGVLQVVITAMGDAGAEQLRTALSAALDGATTAAVQTTVAIPLDESFNRPHAALLLRAMNALSQVTRR